MLIIIEKENGVKHGSDDTLLCIFAISHMD